ncbi:MAG: alkaline phosphatase [Bacteroidales bacterium]|nr:alkaline phosphatase [Bacteroidales bacterium]
MKALKFIAAAIIVSMAVACTSATKPGVPEKVKPTKNLIVMVPDGTSTSLLAVARWYQRYMTDSLEWKLNLDPWLCGFVQSRLSDAIIPDSAPAMSGYMTGVPSRAGNISIYPLPHEGQDVVPTDPDRAYQPAATVLEAAQILKNKAVGVAVTCYFPHATPAATAAHTASRGRYQDIAYQMASHGLDVIFGGGSRYINDEIRGIAAKEGVTVAIDDLDAFRSAEGKTWAIFNSSNMDFEMDRDPKDEPSLSEMTEKAIEILSKDKNGFFLMVEGSKVDSGAHSKDPIETITEFLEFDKAFGKALEFAKKNGNTTVVVLPDHGNSGITLGDANYKGYSSKGPDSMFVNMKNYKMSSSKLTSLMRDTEDSEMVEVFKKWTGIDLKPAEITLLRRGLGRIEDDYMKVSGSVNLQSVICQILASRTHIGFTSGNHTGEDVFLAVYNPNDQRPEGIITNTELTGYLCRVLNFGKSLQDLTDQYFAPAKKVFEGFEMSTEDGENYKTLVVKGNGHTLRIPAFLSEADLDGKPVAVTLPTVYQKENDSFYVDSALGTLLK